MNIAEISKEKRARPLTGEVLPIARLNNSHVLNGSVVVALGEALYFWDSAGGDTLLCATIIEMDAGGNEIARFCAPQDLEQVKYESAAAHTTLVPADIAAIVDLW